MVTGKNFDRVAAITLMLMLAITILFMNGESLGLETVTPKLGYEERLFDNTMVHTIEILMDDWESFIDNAQSEEYSPATVVIDGETFGSVGIRGKGNTSLSTVTSLDSDRYSFKIEFDQYDSGKTYYGLDKLALNNLIQDSTMMKDYLAYTMMKEFGVDSPLCSFVYITVNGEDWGLYLAVEGVEDSFLERNYGAKYGELYKPDSMSFGGGRGNGRDFRMSEFMKENFEGSDSEGTENTETTGTAVPDETPEKSESDQAAGKPEMSGMPQMPGGFGPGGGMPQMPEGFDPGAGMPEMPGMPEGGFPADFDPASAGSNSGRPEMGRPGSGRGGPGGMMGMGASDVKLQYIDDEFDSYSNIWNNAKTDISKADKTRLINSLKQLSEYEDVESVVDIEQVIRYFIVHNFVCNGDSYTGMMIHNYYLHEKDGKLNMIPWDYNLGFGTFQGSDATDTVNTPIDTPSSDRPMVNWIFENEDYTEMYHQYFAEFLDSVDIVGIIDAAYELIAPYVEKDPTSFYTYDEFEKGTDTLRQFCTLRTESIRLQLENGETSEDMNYVDASSLTLSDMGSMNNGGPQGGRDNMKPDIQRWNKMPGDNSEGMTPPDFGSGNMTPPNFGSGNMTPPDFVEGNMTPPDSDPEAMKSTESDTKDLSVSEPAAENSAADAKDSDADPEQTAEMREQPKPQGGSESDESTDSRCEGENCAEPVQRPEAGNRRPSGGDRGGNNMGMTPAGGMEFGGFEGQSGSDSRTAYIWMGVSVLILAAGLIIAKKYR